MPDFDEDVRKVFKRFAEYEDSFVGCYERLATEYMRRIKKIPSYRTILKMCFCEYISRYIKLYIKNMKFNEDNIKEGLRNAFIPNRLEKLCDKPLLLIDGGHNPEALNNLVDSLDNILKGRRLNVVFCSFKDKNIERMLAAIGSIADDLTLTTFDHPRAREEIDYFLFLDEYKYENNCTKALLNYLINYPDDVTLVTGSFAFASYVRKLFKEGKLSNV